MNLNQLKQQIDLLVSQGHGDKEVFYRHGASGDCGPVNGPRITDYVGDSGPFDVDGEYVAISVGY